VHDSSTKSGWWRGVAKSALKLLHCFLLLQLCFLQARDELHLNSLQWLHLTQQRDMVDTQRHMHTASLRRTFDSVASLASSSAAMRASYSWRRRSAANAYKPTHIRRAVKTVPNKT
jgi:hypothetical protein